MNERPNSAAMVHVFQAQRRNRLALKRSTADERSARLARLRDAIVKHAEDADAALNADLRKPLQGANNGEVTSVVKDIDEAIANLASWMAAEHIEPSDFLAGNQARIQYEPRGVVLLLGP